MNSWKKGLRPTHLTQGRDEERERRTGAAHYDGEGHHGLILEA